MERPLRKFKVANPEAERELEQVRGAIWDLYDKVKEAVHTQTGKEESVLAKSIPPHIPLIQNGANAPLP